ncbi:MerR family transcriptional regulator [Pseudonocardia sp. RS010]|uniref:MerR family transcriptional regulator n=1 Tax=Pseudonocardia sp. RS010 TaxID=3385979 RepID=UPI0039A0EC98
MPRPQLTTGQAARAAGLTRKAMRLYEAKGLLPSPERTATGYRLYTPHDVEVLIFIRQARTLGLHLDDIREVLATRDRGLPPCATVRDLLDARIVELEAAAAELTAFRDALAETRQRADSCSDDRPVTVCAILERTNSHLHVHSREPSRPPKGAAPGGR